MLLGWMRIRYHKAENCLFFSASDDINFIPLLFFDVILITLFRDFICHLLREAKLMKSEWFDGSVTLCLFYDDFETKEQFFVAMVGKSHSWILLKDNCMWNESANVICKQFFDQTSLNLMTLWRKRKSNDSTRIRKKNGLQAARTTSVVDSGFQLPLVSFMR